MIPSCCRGVVIVVQSAEGHCGQAEDMPAKMAWGYELLKLTGHELLWEHKLDTKVLIGWGPGGVAVAFRGTASLRNALSDLQVFAQPSVMPVGSLL